MTPRTVNERIKWLIVELGYNPHSFSVEADILPQTLQHIIGGRLTTPSYEVLNKIISRFKEVNPGWVITGDGSPFGEGKPRYIEDIIAELVERVTALELGKNYPSLPQIGESPTQMRFTEKAKTKSKKIN